jgi:HEAT repeat protein
MRRRLTALALTAACLAPLAAAPDAEEAADARALKDAGVGDDGPALLAFFRSRTLNDADRRRLDDLVGQLAAEDFETREKATQELKKRGPSALAPLRRAAEHPDLEVSRRARDVIAFLEEGPGAGLPLAAARLLARRAPADAVPVLLAYLPFAEDETVEDEALAALLALTALGKADAALADALRAPSAVQRGAAAHVLGRKGDDRQREAVAGLLADKEAKVRLRAALALLGARDRRAVPTLISLVGDGPLDLAWQAEEVLIRLAGDEAPAAAGRGDDRRKARDAWLAWWRDKGDAVDLARFDDGQRLLGLTLAIEYNTGRVWECGPDGKPRLDIRGLAGPMEAQILPGGRVLIAESNNRTVSVRDFKGAVLWSKVLDNGEPTGAQRLPNGNIFVSTYGTALEYDPAGKKLYDVPLGGGSNGIWKARNGHIIYTTDAEIVEIDTAGKKLRGVPIPRQSMWVGVQDLPGDRFMVCNSSTGQVLEVSGAGKVLWEGNVSGACGVCRLPNGHTLIGTANKVVELDRLGKSVWEKPTDGYVRRVHRR